VRTNASVALLVRWEICFLQQFCSFFCCLPAVLSVRARLFLLLSRGMHPMSGKSKQMRKIFVIPGSTSIRARLIRWLSWSIWRRRTIPRPVWRGSVPAVRRPRWVSRAASCILRWRPAALSQTGRSEVLFGNRFDGQVVQDFQVELDLNYNVFDFGARSGRINAASAEVLAANFAFQRYTSHVIYQVEQAYYRLLNSIGQEELPATVFSHPPR